MKRTIEALVALKQAVIDDNRDSSLSNGMVDYLLDYADTMIRELDPTHPDIQFD